MIPVKKAIQIVLDKSKPIGSESVRIGNAVGRVLAESIVADDDMPPFDRSQMDGYALREQDARKVPAILKIIGESAAGRGWHKRLGRGESVRIMTGAPVPAGADAVQKVELTKESNGSVEIIEPTAKGRYIVKKGLEIRKGARLFQSGQIIDEKMIATLAAFGYPSVEVAAQPSVSILATGSEIVAIEKKPGLDQIRNSNSVMLKALCEQAGARVRLLRQAGDDLSKLKSVIKMAVNDPARKSQIRNPNSQILVMTGGVSVGKYDLTKVALKELGAEIFFEKVQLKPGKPTVFARLGDTLVFGLPGNPVSAAVTFYLFVRAAILTMQKASETALPGGSAVLAAAAKAAGERDSYLPATLATDTSGRLLVTPLRWHGSSDFVGFAQAEVLISLAKGTSAAAGEVVKILFL